MTTRSSKRIGLVLGSMIVSLWHFGPLEGSVLALLLTVGGQLFLFGYLSARAIGLLRETQNMVIRLTWMMVCGLGITIVLGAFARLLMLPVPVFVIGLHIVMLLLSLIPASVAPAEPIDRKTLPFYLLLLLTCVVFVLVGWERNRLWFDAYGDQSLPVSLADWWAHQPQPESLVTRAIAETRSLSYWSSDGLTYVFASWIWTGRFSAVQLIWYALTPLLAWLVPIAHFSVAYQLTKRLDTATWAAGFVLLLALMTILGPQQLGDAWLFGQEAAFQLSTLRTFSTALLLPLALFVFFSAVQTANSRYYAMTSIIVLALAFTHPRQFLAIVTAIYAILGVRFLMMPGKARFRESILLGLAILPALLIPLWQYSGHAESLLTPDLLPDIAAAATISTTLIEPRELLFHPFIPLALLLGIASVVKVRRSLVAQFILTTIILLFVLAYLPPVFNAILRIFGTYYGVHYVMELFFVIPFGLILSIAVSFVIDQLSQRYQLNQTTSHWIITSLFAVTALILLIEPLPIQRSTRDQLYAANLIQSLRDIQPFEEQLLERLRTLPVTGDKVVYLTSNIQANYVIESVPNAFVTGGRSEANPAHAGSSRYFDAENAPWLDAEDIEFLQTYNVDYLVLPADNTRIPQLILQPERFEQVDTIAGYVIFRVLQIDTVTTSDQLFGQMNALYEAETSPRWDTDGFDPNDDSDPDLWQPMIAEWRDLLSQDRESEVNRYGLAFATLMSGEPEPDLWGSLSGAHPDIFLLTGVHAQVSNASGQEQNAVDLLLGALDSRHADVRVLAARTLLTEQFFYTLTAQQVDTIVAVAESDNMVWSNLMEWDHADALRMRAALMMSAGRFDVVQQWLSRIPAVLITPRDLTAQAAIELSQGSIDGASTLLQPATDRDWIYPRANLNRSGWTGEANTAARFYQLLTTPSDNTVSPLLIAETGQIFANQPEIDQQEDQLTVSAVVGDFTPALSPQMVTVQVTSPDGAAFYGEAVIPLELNIGAMERIAIPVELSPDIVSETPALVSISIAYSANVVYQTLRIETMLSPSD